MSGAVDTIAQGLAQWVLGQAADASGLLLREVIFQPLNWTPWAEQLFAVSRQLLLGVLSVFLSWALLRSMWPQSPPGAHLTPQEVLVKAGQALVLSVAIAPVVQWCLSLNNALVTQLMPAQGGDWLPLSPAVVLTAPLLGLLTMGAAIWASFWLGIYYAWRSIEVVVLTALVPWVAFASLFAPHDGAVRRMLADLMAAIFVQSLLAASFWLFLHLVVQGQTLFGELEAVGVLWYMTRLPQRLSHWLGGGGGTWR